MHEAAIFVMAQQQVYLQLLKINTSLLDMMYQSHN